MPDGVQAGPRVQAAAPDGFDKRARREELMSQGHSFGIAERIAARELIRYRQAQKTPEERAIMRERILESGAYKPKLKKYNGGELPSMNQQQYPMQPMANALANQGRYGDTELVHVNKDELKGLASLVPNGRLTTNPMTGQPEAFLVTLLGSILGKTLLAGKFAGGLGGLIGAGGLSSSAAGAIGSGIAATAATGDVKKGLVSAVTGYGLGQVMGGLGDAVPDATAIGDASIDAAKLTAQQTGEEFLKEGGGSALKAGMEEGSAYFAQPELYDAGLKHSMALTELDKVRNVAAADVGEALKSEGFKGNLQNLTDIKGITSGIMEPSALAAIGVGEGTRGQMMAQEETERAFEESERQREEDYRRNMANITGAESQLSEDYPGAVAYSYDPDPYRMGSSYGSEYAAASGGIVSLNPRGYEDAYNGLMQLGGSPVRMRRGGPVEDPDAPKNPAVLFAPGTPASRQSKLRPPRVVTPEELEGYRPGIDPEIMYFRKPIATESDTSTNTTSRPPINTGSKGGRPNLPGYEEASMSDVLSTGAGSYGAAAESPIEDFGYMPEFVQRPDRFKRFQNISSEEPVVSAAETQTPLYTQEDSSIRIGQGSPLIMDQVAKNETTTEPFVIPKSVQDEIAESMEGIGGPRSMRFMNEGGMASLDQQSQGIGGLVNQPQAIQPEASTEDPIIDQIIMVILGRIEGEQADAILNTFISTYGEEAYLALRDQVLTSVVPDAQTEGVIDGAGGGMDDMVQGMIGDQQRVAVSPGEYIVAADVVSGLGDGNTDSGADRLDKMVDMVRMQKNGTLKQPDRLKEDEVSV